MSNLHNPLSYRPTRDQLVAFERLANNGIVIRKFIRAAINEKLHKDYRTLMAEAQKKAEQPRKKWKLSDHVCSMSFPPRPYEK